MALIGRFILPAISLLTFAWILLENRARRSGVDPQTGLDATGMPFQSVHITAIAVVSCLTIASLLFALRRHGVVAGLLAAVALIFIFFVRLNSFWPD